MRKFLAVSTVSFGLLSAIYVFVPLMRKPLVREDNLLEMFTAVLFLAVAILGTKLLASRVRGTGHWIDWLVPTLAGLGFLEEVSFGRLFYDETPVVQGVKVDALHDYLRVILNIAESGEHTGVLFISGVIATAACVGLLIRFKPLLHALLDRESFRFCVLCLGFVGFASIIDLDFLDHFYMAFAEEFTEALASLALLFAYRSLRLAQITQHSPELEGHRTAGSET